MQGDLLLNEPDCVSIVEPSGYCSVDCSLCTVRAECLIDLHDLETAHRQLLIDVCDCSIQRGLYV